MLASAAGFPQTRQGDREAAERYLEQARRQAAAGAWEGVAALLDRSLEFFPEYSESCLLYARLALREQEGTRSGLDWLGRSLASGTWTATDPAQASVEQAAVLVRTRRFAEARRVLGALSEGSAGPGLAAREDPEAALLWGRTLLALGDPAAAGRHLELALARYPREPRLYLEQARALLALERMGKAKREGGALELLARGRRALPDAPALTLEAARLERERARRLALLEEYVRQGGTAPAAAALALRAGPGEPSVWQERFLSWGGLGEAGPLQELLSFYRSLPEPLFSALRRYSGPSVLDMDEDGYYEERWQFQDGGLENWVLDRDQDGVAEAEVQFDAGQPRSLAAGGLEYRYSAYPYLAEVSARDGRGRRLYEMQPYRERLALFAGSPPFGPGPLRLTSSRWPTEGEVGRMAYAMRETSDAGAERRYTLLAGQVARLEESPDQGGRYGRVVEYSRGRPVAGRRDLDRDGIFEVRESYLEGKLVGLAEDRDGDGRPEYREQLGAEGSRRFWDYDDDGLADSREWQQADGSLLREFSSRRDGKFDLYAVFRDDLLVEFRRGGRVLPVTASAAAGLYWLGRPAGNAERFLSLPDGLHWLDGASWFVFTHAGRRYVEQL
jgi:hypothetical protein